MQKKMLKAAIHANKEIYNTINKGYKDEWHKQYSVGAGGDISSGFDLFCEKTFVKYLQEFGEIESEESGVIGEGERKIIIDPLDGSSNADANLPYYGSSVAFLDKEGILELAVVCNFANGDIFYKFANSKLMVGNILTEKFKEEISSYSQKIGIFEKAYAYPAIVNKLNNIGIKFRTPGAIALSLAYAHRVNFVIFKGSLRIYDFAAALAFCEDLKVSISQDYVIVTHSKELLEVLEKFLIEEDL